MSELPVLHVDDEIVAVHKPPGLLVHRTALASRGERFALQQVRDRVGARVWPVHRLDRGTSGVLVFARSPAVARTLGGAFGARAVEKRYLALVRGWPAPVGTIEHPLSRRFDDVEPEFARTAGLEARPAATSFVRLATIELPIAVDRYPTSRYALLRVTPHTGRRHQIRRHLKHVSHPIVGDATYGKGRHNRAMAALLGVQRLWLHAESISFIHPSAGTTLTITAPPDDAWRRLLALAQWVWDDALMPPAA